MTIEGSRGSENLLYNMRIVIKYILKLVELCKDIVDEFDDELFNEDGEYK